MQIAEKRDLQRSLLAAAAALALHALIFLAVELGHLLRFESEGPAYGAMFVDISDLSPDAGVLSRPETAPPAPEKKPDAPRPEEPDGPVTDLSVTDPKAVPQVPARKPEEKKPVTAPAPAAPPANLYSVKEANGSTLGVEMGNKTDKAKPNWRTGIILPKWVLDEKIKLYVVISFVVGKDGFLSAEPVIEESSGYPDVDEAVKRAMMSGWKFSNPTDSNYSVGKLTYKVNQ